MADPTQGKWDILMDENDNPVNSQVTAIHAHVIAVPNGATNHPICKILYWHARYPSNYTTDNFETTPNFISCLFDPVTNVIEQFIIPRWNDIIGDENLDPSKLFCSGHAQLANGMLLAAGGERNQPPWLSNGTKYSFVFDPSVLNNTTPLPWKKTGVDPDEPEMMNHGRWYPQLTKLHDGTIIAMSGYPEVWDPDSVPVVIFPERYDPISQTWSEYTEIEATKQVPLYVGAYVIPFGDWKGQIFYDLVTFGPSLPDYKRAHRFDPFAAPHGDYWNPVTIDDSKIGYHGSSFSLPIKSTDTDIKIVNLGGFGSGLPKSAEVIAIKSNTDPVWINTGALNYDRHDCPIALVIADGTAMVIGGGSATDASLIHETLDYSDPDPENWTWTALTDAVMNVPRKYHSTGLLIPDGRVWVAGSRIYTEPQNFEFENDMERRIEYYSPQYLFEGTRPEITDAPLSIHYEDEYFDVSFYDVDSMVINSVVLITLPTVTHCLDSNQRYLILDFSIPINYPTGMLRVVPPADGYLAPPGYYMLFLLSDISMSNSGNVRIPSVAKIVKVGPAL